MIYLRLLKTVAGSDGTLFLKGVCFWASISDGIATIRYRRQNRMTTLRLLPQHYETLITDPSFEDNPTFGVKFEGKNVKKGGE